MSPDDLIQHSAGIQVYHNSSSCWLCVLYMNTIRRPSFFDGRSHRSIEAGLCTVYPLSSPHFLCNYGLAWHAGRNCYSHSTRH